MLIDIDELGRLNLTKSFIDRNVVSIKNINYFKSSSKLVKIGGRYYRKSSNSIIKDVLGRYIKKSDKITLYDGAIASRKSPELVPISNSDEYGLLGYNTTLVADSVNYESLYLKNSDPRLIEDFDSNNFILKKDSVPLSDYYGFDSNGFKRHTHKGNAFQCVHSKSNFLASDSFQVGDYLVFKDYASKIKSFLAITEFYLENNNISIYYNYYLSNENLYYSSKHQVYFYGEELMKSYEKTYSDLKKLNKLRTSNLCKNLDPSFGSLSNLDIYDEYEKVPESVFVKEGDISGKRVYFNPSNYSSRMIFSETKKLTGGIGYTFGLEHESCAGIVPFYHLEKHGLSAVGDGSTRFSHRDTLVHYEYVTSILHGDRGIKKMSNYMDVFSNHLLGNTKCSTHIHVGGKLSSKKSTDYPKYNREFSAYLINLCAQVEDSLADLLPSSRNPKTNEYCSSISNWCEFPINTKEDQKKIIADFIFQSDNLNSEYNSKKQFSVWTRSKRKWVNLINVNSAGYYNGNNNPTVEFRIFPFTTNKFKCHFYTLISLSLVWFAENRKRMIQEGNLDITKVLNETYKNKYVYNYVKEYLKGNFNFESIK